MEGVMMYVGYEGDVQGCTPHGALPSTMAMPAG